MGQAYVSDAVELIDDLDAYVILRADWASYQFGARRYNRFNLRPAARLSYRTEFGRFALIYKRGVLRPSADQLNPEIDYLSEFEQTVGNTDLGQNSQTIWSLPMVSLWGAPTYRLTPRRLRRGI